MNVKIIRPCVVSRKARKKDEIVPDLDDKEATFLIGIGCAVKVEAVEPKSEEKAEEKKGKAQKGEK